MGRIKVKLESVLEQEFCNPEMEYQPEMRWWLAEGSHTKETLRHSVRELYAAGFRAVELITRTDAVLDKTRWGWGGEAWNENCRVILEEATELGMGVSFTSGPNWYTAVPGITPDDNAAVQELAFDWRLLPPGGRLTESVSMSAKSSMVKKCRLVRVIAARLAGTYNYEIGSVTYLDESSLLDISEYCAVWGQSIELDWQAPEDGDYLVFVFWQQGTAQVATASIEPAYVVNHYSKDGAMAVADFWDRTLLTPDLLHLIRKNNNVEFFEDSLEIGTQRGSLLFWSDSFLEEFSELRGYDLSLYLPVLIREKQRYVTPLNDPIFTLDGAEQKCKQIHNDLAITYSQLYERDYIGTLQEWLHRRGMCYRAQVTYGQWQDQGLAVRAVERPELETLFFHDEPDAYRLQTGTVHLYRKPLLSLEMGAVFGRVYHVDVREYLRMMNLAFSVGVNRTVFHGYCCQPGPEGNVQWPGYDGIENGWSDRWGERMPLWSQIHSLTGYISRVQKAMRQGKAKIDIAIVAQCFWASSLVAPQKQDIHTYWENELGLQEAGYSYDYITPGIMDDPSVFPVEDSVLAPDGPGYRAMVVWQSEISAQGAEFLLNLARKGLPMVLVQGAMMSCAGWENWGDERVAYAAAALRRLPNVLSVADKAGVPAALRQLGVLPRMCFLQPARLLTALREQDDKRFLFVYNDTDKVQETEIVAEGPLLVCKLNLWTGKTETVCTQRIESEQFCFQVQIQPEDSALYVLSNDRGDETESTPEEKRRWETLPLSVWNLIVEAWKPGQRQCIRTIERSEFFYETRKEPVTLRLEHLKTWDEISELGTEISGTACYETTFTLPHGTTAVRVDLGDYLGLADVAVNNLSAPTVNPVISVLDITKLCHEGVNQLTIRYASLLGNAALASGSIQAHPVPVNFRGNTYHAGSNNQTGFRSYGLKQVVVEAVEL